MDDFITLGAFVGSAAYIARYRIYLGGWSDVVFTGIANFCFAILFGRIATNEFCYWTSIPKDDSVSIAIGGTLAMLSPWIMDKLAPDIGRKLTTWVKGFNLKSLMARLLGLSEKK